MSGVADPAQVTVTMDSTPISSALIGIPFPADPGKHVFVAAADGYSSQSVERSLPEGGKDIIELKTPGVVCFDDWGYPGGSSARHWRRE
ncbi:MAG: hypothetical protein QM784_10825 [Polyangiaceae bacterium]